MQTLKRRSPIVFAREAVKTETRHGWDVTLEYEAEGKGPWVIDLSHRSRWDVQDAHLDDIEPFACTIPETPGQSRLAKGMLINRMNRTQAAIWHISGEQPAPPTENAFTETTDATLFLALIGDQVFSICEKLTALDLSAPVDTYPALYQGPFGHVPSQIVVMHPSPKDTAVLFTCSRGYAQDMLHAILEAGGTAGLIPAGENAFRHWIDSR